MGSESKVDEKCALYENIFPGGKSKESFPFRLEEDETIASLQFKCEELRGQLQQQIKRNERAQEEIERLQNQILNQSTYCASLGAVLGNLTWRASSFPQIVDVWLSGLVSGIRRIQLQPKIGELLSIVNGSFTAFINTYSENFPPTSNVEFQFVIGLLGIVSNISASPEGREFLITNPSGRSFVEKMIKLMPSLPIYGGTFSFERLMLMILYNVSMNKMGLECLFESHVGNVLNHCLENNSLPEETQLLCLHVLQSITYDLNNPRYIRDLIRSVPIKKIEEMTSINKNGMGDIARQVIQNLNSAHKFLISN